MPTAQHRLPRHRLLRPSLVLVVLLAASGCQSDGSEPDATAGDAASGESSDAGTTAATDGEGTPGAAGVEAPVAAPVRDPASARPIYFVMTDRFANGDPSNDRGGIQSTDALVTGYLPADTGYHQGGDLVGLVERLDYVEGLGVGAIWVTPPFTNRFVQGDGTVEGSSSSYHGSWPTDYSAVDPHLGDADDLQRLVDEAHARDIDVYLDAVVNHTADVIRLADRPTYVPTSTAPYVDADGEKVDLTALADEALPTFDAATSFPYEPSFAEPGDADAKFPDWLDDVTLYHNRGNSTFEGESLLLGDVFGLDDLMTEHPRVLEGMTELHGDIAVDVGVDGFRVDTMQHVDDEFWATWLPSVQQAAAEAGAEDFFVFGEAVAPDASTPSGYTRLGADGTLDLLVAGALEDYVTGGSSAVMAEALDGDDAFTDADNNASMQVTFFGNHDMGRMGFQVDRGTAGADDEELLDRMRLGFDLLFTIRGVPVVTYGDEQGFTGDGGDRAARATMFPAIAADYVDDDNIGSDVTPGADNFDTGHPLYRHVAARAATRAELPALVTGAMVVHEVDDDAAFAFSRVDRDERLEVVVVANSGVDNLTIDVPTLSPDTEFRAVAGFEARQRTATSDADGLLEVDVPAVSTVVLLASATVPEIEAPPSIDLVRPEPGAGLTMPRYRVEAEVGDRRLAEVTFAVAVDGGEPEVIGVDDAPPYRVYWDSTSLEDGTPVELMATVADGSDRTATDRVDVTLGARDAG